MQLQSHWMKRIFNLILINYIASFEMWLALSLYLTRSNHMLRIPK